MIKHDTGATPMCNFAITPKDTMLEKSASYDLDNLLRLRSFLGHPLESRFKNSLNHWKLDLVSPVSKILFLMENSINK